MLSTTMQSPQRSHTQTSIPSRNPRTPRSPETRTVEISTQDPSHHHLAHSLAIPRVEVPSVTGTMAATRPGPGPGRPQEVAEAEAVATTPPGVTMATEAAAEAATAQVTMATDHTEVGALDPTRADTTMVATATIPMATLKATWWRKSCLPSSPWWWSRWWAPRPPTSSATGGEIASEPTHRRTSEDLDMPWGPVPPSPVESLLRPWLP